MPEPQEELESVDNVSKTSKILDFFKQPIKEIKKEKTKPLTKIVIRRLPPRVTKEQFLEAFQLPPHDYFHFIRGDLSMGIHSFSRAYVNFQNVDDIFTFKEKYDDHPLRDEQGREYHAVVEWAPVQRIPKKIQQKKKVKVGSLESDPKYVEFLEKLEEEKNVQVTVSEYFLETESASVKEAKVTTTPLLEFIKLKRQRKIDIRNENRLKRRELEKERRRKEDEARRTERLKKHKDEKKIGEKVEEGIPEGPDDPVEDESTKDDKKEEPVTEVKETAKETKPKKEVKSIKVDRIERRESVKKGSRKTSEFRDKKASGDYKREKDSGDYKKEKASGDYKKEKVSGDYKEKGSGDYKKEKASGDYKKEKESGDRRKEKDSSDRRKEKDSSDSKKEKDSVDIKETVKEGNASALVEATTTATSKSSSINRSTVDPTPRVPVAKSKFRYSEQRTVRNQKLEALKDKPNADEQTSDVQDDEKKPKSDCPESDEMVQKESTPDLDGSDDASNHEDAPSSSSGRRRDPRTERRIRNKDRPSIEIYRPGMGRFSSKRSEPRKDDHASNKGSGANSEADDAGDKSEASVRSRTFSRSTSKATAQQQRFRKPK